LLLHARLHLFAAASLLTLAGISSAKAKDPPQTSGAGAQARRLGMGPGSTTAPQAAGWAGGSSGACVMAADCAFITPATPAPASTASAEAARQRLLGVRAARSAAPTTPARRACGVLKPCRRRCVPRRLVRSGDRRASGPGQRQGGCVVTILHRDRRLLQRRVHGARRSFSNSRRRRAINPGRLRGVPSPAGPRRGLCTIDEPARTAPAADSNTCAAPGTSV
jgi:hypothetical protein